MADPLTITMTNRPPVKIDKDKWPVIASSKSFQGEHEFQANWKKKLTVRQHADGRTIIYGVYESSYRDSRDRRAGEMVQSDGTTADLVGDTAPIIEAIIRVAGYLEFDRQLADECIADLPAVEI